jgi:uncharacterized repeat protein (TIGR03803 family)
MKTKSVFSCVTMLFVGSVIVTAQSYAPLYDLGTNANDPQFPQGAFAQGRDGNLYSTTPNGGENGYGTVFQLTTTGKLKVLFSFTGENAQGGYPAGGLTLGTDGALYGTSLFDTANGLPNVFKITTAGKLTVLHEFNGTTEGDDPLIAPIQATDGNFYGTSSDGVTNYGAVYRMTPNGNTSVIYQFQSTPTDAYRYPGALLQGSDGNFYGTTGGQLLYKLTSQGKIKELHTFTGYPSDGWDPAGPLIQASDGYIYGTTTQGGTDDAGTIYKLSPSGAYSVIYSFSYPDSDSPYAGVVQGTDGNFYGGTNHGGSVFLGTLFQFTPGGIYTVVYDGFDSQLGAYPDSPLLQHTNGLFYGATVHDGTGTACFGSGCGVLYSFDMGFGPFVTFLPAQSSGTAGSSIGVFGQGFTGTTSVKFAGIAASFTVVSSTFLTAIVPSGAKTGFISVKTPGGTLTSNKTFVVR